MILKRTSSAVTVAILVLGTATALRFAQGFDLVAPDVSTRAMQVVIGLVLAAYANLLPKDIGRWRASVMAAARAQSALRVGGWSMTLAGIAYAGLWAFAPLALAGAAGMAVVASAMLITIGYGGWTAFACRRSQTSAS